MAAFIDWDMNILHINTFVFNAFIETVEYPAIIPNFFCRTWKIFVMYWSFVYFMFWNVVLGVAARTSLRVPTEFEDSSWSPCFQESEFWAFSCRLTWEHSISGLWVARRLSSSLEPLVLALPSVTLHWTSLLDLSLTWRSAFRSDQKENYWNGCRRTSRNSLC